MSVGLLLEVRDAGRDGESVPQGICWDGDITGSVAGVEGYGVAIFGGYLGWGGTSAPADRLHRPA